jgi:hypothetical protein
VPAAEAYLADEIEETNAFLTCELAQSDQTTQVNNCAVNIPPVACRLPWSGTMGNEQNNCHESLRDDKQDRARAYEEQRTDPRDKPTRHSRADLRKSV